MKVWSIVRSIWNCMLAMYIRLWLIISIVAMLLWKVIISISKKWLKKNKNMPINSWNTKINVVVQSFFLISKFVDWRRENQWIFLFYESRNQHNKAGVRLSKLMKQLYNWKRMSTKHCLNYMHRLRNTRNWNFQSN